jgi:predicted acyltransferase
MFTMIFVNDLAGAPRDIVPWWMRHFKANGNGMTFVDLVFPAFLFIVGMSIPLALGGRRSQGESVLGTVCHVIGRTLSLLIIGILMVNETPDSAKLGWSGDLWSTLMYLSAILAFCSLGAPRGSNSDEAKNRNIRYTTFALRTAAAAGLVYLAFSFRGSDGHSIVSLSPFSIHTSWYGILGLIGWAYLVAALVFLLFGVNRTALLACAALLMCLYPADKKGAFDHFWLNHYVGIGGTLGSQAAITVAGLLLGSILVTPETATAGARTRFTLLFITGFAAAAYLLHGLYGINKNAATPSWCLWASAITATLWLLLYWLGDVAKLGVLTKPLAIAGQNVLLAYLLSEMLPSALTVIHLDGWYDRLASPDLAHAVARSAGCGIVLLAATAGLNRVGFRLKI